MRSPTLVYLGALKAYFERFVIENGEAPRIAYRMALRRLIADAALVRDSDPRFTEKATRLRVLRALNLDESAWTAGAMHAFGALCHVKIPAETISDGLVAIERMNPVNAWNCKQYKATYLPETYENKNPRAEKREPMECTPYTGHLDDKFELRCFVVTHDGDTVQVRVPIKDFRPIYRTSKRVDFRGGFRHEDTIAHEWRSHFRIQHKMWNSSQYPNSFVFAA